VKSFSNLCLSVRRVLALSIALTTLPTAWAWNYETVFEFVAEADLDGDGTNDIVIVDKLTGALRAAYQLSPGDPHWADVRATGISGVTGLGIGRVLNTARDTVVATSPTANRVNLLEVTTSNAPAVPVTVFIGSLGPNAVAAIDIGGGGNTAHADLYIASRDNPGARETLVHSSGASQSILSDNALTASRRAFNPFIYKTGQPARLGLVRDAAGLFGPAFVLVDLASGVPTSSIDFTLPYPLNAQPEFVAAQFGNGNPLAQTLFYLRGGNSLMKYQITEPIAGTFVLGSSNAFALGQPIQLVQVLARPTGPRLLVLFGVSATNATVATVYDFDGTNAPVVVQSFTNAGGFTAAASLGGGNFSLLASDGTGRSTTFQNWLASGHGYAPGTSGILPKVTPYSGEANVVMFNGEPFVNPAARALRSVRVRDWSSSPVVSGGPPPSVTATGEKFLSASNGLSQPTATSLGSAPIGTTHALVNQYATPVSIFSRRTASGDEPGAISISPLPGEYPTAIQITFTTTPGTWSARYRLGTSGAWLVYAAPITLFSNATIQFHAQQPPPGQARTAVQTASYSFVEPVSALDSDGDGVPDYVETAKNLDPRGGEDSDGDGFTDLEELIAGTLANNGSNHPASNLLRLESTAGFDRVVTPRGVNAGGGNSLSRRHTEVHVFAIDSNPIGSGLTTNISTPISSSSSAKMTNLVVPSGDKLAIETTPPHFDLISIGSDTRIGRELIGLIPLPVISNVVVPFTYTGGVVSVAASNWIVSASNTLGAFRRPQVIGNLTAEDALVSALFEQKLAEVLAARGTNWSTNLTLFAFRPTDEARTPVSRATLSDLEAHVSPALPGFNHRTLANHFDFVKTSVAPNHIALRDAAREIYRLSATFHNSNPPAYPPPFDELRKLVSGRSLGSNYAAQAPLSGLLANARLGASNLLFTAPPRPTTNVILEVIVSTPGAEPVFRLLGSATPATLWQRDGSPCLLPAGFELLAGSLVSVFAHTDLAPGLPGLALEVITLTLASVPLASDLDANGDLLIDSWQNAFFGGGVGDPFTDNDGDGYSNIEEMFLGSDPKNLFNLPGGVPVNFSRPALELTLNPQLSQTTLQFQWPLTYIGNFTFGVRASQTVDGGFVDLPVGEPVHLGGNNFSVNVNLPVAPNQFYYLTIALRP
jgi:hypothetical protein